MNNKKVAVLIPCFNESKTIHKVITDFSNILPDADIYVYDNNSSDGSDEIVKKTKATLRHEYRQGKGNVIRSMLRQIDADCYLIVDGDDTYPAEHAPELIAPVISNRADMVVGDRLSSTYFKEERRKFHGFGNIMVCKLINNIFKTELHDIMSGYRALSKFFAKNFPILSSGFEIETEMTIHALDNGFSIIELPVFYRNRPLGSYSKLNTVKDGIRVINKIMILFKDYKPFTFFGLLAILGLLICFSLFIPILIEFLNTGLVPRFPTLIIAGVVLVISLLLLVCGVILNTIQRNKKFFYELFLNK